MDGRLLVRPGTITGLATPGLQPLGAEQGRGGWLYVPPAGADKQPMRLILTLHGAGGEGRHGLDLFMSLADVNRLLLLAPDSRGRTWDLLEGGFGSDVAFIDRALQDVFSTYSLSGMAIAGFSDGASYALSLGLTNGDLFDHLLAFSPGFMAPATLHGQPRVFISHGVADTVLPISCSRRIVPALKKAGYDVLYREFPDGHIVPAELAAEAVRWSDRSPT